jgi:hypothetical protein
MTKHNLTTRQYLIERCRLDQWRAWDAHAAAEEALAAGRTLNAGYWQLEAATHALLAACDLDRLLYGSDLDTVF